MNIDMPMKAADIINKLREQGHEAYIVGGCVRDAILGREPDDWDITTSALPDCVKMIFRRTIDTGIKHGTITVMMGKEGFEVTTYRIDGEYADGRHPDNVEFTASLLEDLKRRDFTINAMAYNDEDGVVDEFGGIDDLNNGIIKCVGNPYDRFTEDALRMMRAVRFSAQLTFAIDGNTFDAIRKLNENITKVSKERIQVELTKTLNSANPDYIKYFYTSGLSRYFFPIIDEHIEKGDFERVACMLKEVEPVTALRYAVLFMDSGEDAAREAMLGLKFDNINTEAVSKIAKYAKNELGTKPGDIKRWLNLLGEELFKKLLCCRKAYDKAHNMDISSYELIEAVIKEIIEKEEPYTLKSLKINGKTLMAMGVEPGKAIGRILNDLLDRVMDEPKLNDEETLKELVKTYIKEK